jgi:hypothetical protein
MLVQRAVTSSVVRVFRTQSGLTQSRSAGTDFSASCSDKVIFSTLGTRGARLVDVVDAGSDAVGEPGGVDVT